MAFDEQPYNLRGPCDQPSIVYITQNRALEERKDMINYDPDPTKWKATAAGGVPVSSVSPSKRVGVSISPAVTGPASTWPGSSSTGTVGADTLLAGTSAATTSSVDSTTPLDRSLAAIDTVTVRGGGGDSALTASRTASPRSAAPAHRR